MEGIGTSLQVLVVDVSEARSLRLCSELGGAITSVGLSESSQGVHLLKAEDGTHNLDTGSCNIVMVNEINPININSAQIPFNQSEKPRMQWSFSSQQLQIYQVHAKAEMFGEISHVGNFF